MTLSLKNRGLLILPVLVALLALAGVATGILLASRDHGPVWITETHTLNQAVYPPQWMKTVEKVALPKLKEDGTSNKSGHTTKVILPGSKVSYITFENVGIKAGSTPTTVILKVNGNGGSAPAGTYLIVDKLVMDNLDAVKATFGDSEYGKIVLTNIEADGASLHHSVQKVTAYPPFHSQEWNGLPGLDLKDIRTDEIIVEVATADAKVGVLTLKNIRTPGAVEVLRVKGNELTVKDSSFGDGDDDSATHAIVLPDTVKQGTFSQTNVKADVKVNNK